MDKQLPLRWACLDSDIGNNGKSEVSIGVSLLDPVCLVLRADRRHNRVSTLWKSAKISKLESRFYSPMLEKNIKHVGGNEA